MNLLPTWLSRSLLARLLVVSLLAQGLTVVILLANAVNLTNEALNRRVQDEVKQTRDAVGGVLAPYVFARDFAAARSFLAQAPLAYSYVAVLDDQNELFVHAGNLPIPGVLPPPDENLESALPRGVFHVRAPLILSGQVVGALQVGYDLSGLTQEKQRLLWMSAGIGLLGLVLSGVLLFALGLVLTRHIRQLTENARRVSEGQFDQLQAVNATDEVGTLAQALARMSQAIHTRTAALQAAEANQRHLAEVAKAEQARMGALLSAMNVGILFESRQGKVEFFNPAFLSIWAMERDLDLVGRATESILALSTHSFARPEHASQYVLHVVGTHEISERHEIHLADGRVLTQLSYPVADADGRSLGRMWLYEDITRQRQTAEQLVYLAERDSLTGLFNRHRFKAELERTLQISARAGSKFALLYFDLDEFKYINDTFGHSAGDTVLVRVTGELNTQIRNGEVFARLGGDEFAILCPCKQQDDIRALAQRVLRSVAQIPFRFRGQNMRLTTSVGIAIFPEHGQSTEELVAHADTAMYAAKQHGKNTFAVYDPGLDKTTSMVTHLTWKDRLRRALEEGLLELHFQGVYNVNTGALQHLEALVRMLDTDQPGALIMPGSFIPQAERSGQILDLDRWVIVSVVGLLARDPQLPHIAINISGRSFDDPGLPFFIRNQLTQAGVARSRLIIELTETAAVSDMQDAQRFIQALHQTGCEVCLDDFGAGFSSFAYLKHIQADVLKIDGQFIRDLSTDHDNQVFVRAMVDVAKGLHKRTVAEFVESAGVFATLKSLGVDMAQGYHLDKPTRHHPQLKGHSPPRYRVLAGELVAV